MGRGPGTGTESWNDAGQTRQRTPWLALTAGQRYYYEVLHNTGAGASNNLAVGWLQDATGTAASPGGRRRQRPGRHCRRQGGVVPGYVLYAFDYPRPPPRPGRSTSRTSRRRAPPRAARHRVRPTCACSPATRRRSCISITAACPRRARPTTSTSRRIAPAAAPSSSTSTTWTNSTRN